MIKYPVPTKQHISFSSANKTFSKIKLIFGHKGSKKEKEKIDIMNITFFFNDNQIGSYNKNFKTKPLEDHWFRN